MLSLNIQKVINIERNYSARDDTLAQVRKGRRKVLPTSVAVTKCLLEVRQLHVLQPTFSSHHLPDNTPSHPIDPQIPKMLHTFYGLPPFSPSLSIRKTLCLLIYAFCASHKQKKANY
jgi:hypothetical protein